MKDDLNFLINFKYWKMRKVLNLKRKTLQDDNAGSDANDSELSRDDQGVKTPSRKHDYKAYKKAYDK